MDFAASFSMGFPQLQERNMMSFFMRNIDMNVILRETGKAIGNSSISWQNVLPANIRKAKFSQTYVLCSILRRSVYIYSYMYSHAVHASVFFR